MFQISLRKKGFTPKLYQLVSSFHSSPALLAGRNSGSQALEPRPRDFSKKQKKKHAEKMAEFSRQKNKKQEKLKERVLEKQIKSTDLDSLFDQVEESMGNTVQQLLKPENPLDPLLPQKESLLEDETLRLHHSSIIQSLTLALSHHSTENSQSLSSLVDLTPESLNKTLQYYCQNGWKKSSSNIRLLRNLPSFGVPLSPESYLSMMQAANKAGQFEQTEKIFDEMLGLGQGNSSAESSVNPSVNPPSFLSRLFEPFLSSSLPDHSSPPPSLEAWNCLVHSKAMRGDAEGALKVMDGLRGCGLSPSPQMYTSLLDCYVSVLKDYERAEDHWINMHFHVQPLPLEAFHIILTQAAKTKQSERAFFYLDEMRSLGLAPTAETFRRLFRACAEAPQWVNGYQDTIFDAMIAMEGYEIQPTVDVYNSVIHAFAKCGDNLAAEFYFWEMQRKGLVPTPETYRALLMAFAWNQSVGLPHRALARGRYVRKVEKKTPMQRDHATLGAERIAKIMSSGFHQEDQEKGKGRVRGVLHNFNVEESVGPSLDGEDSVISDQIREEASEERKRRRTEKRIKIESLIQHRLREQLPSPSPSRPSSPPPSLSPPPPSDFLSEFRTQVHRVFSDQQGDMERASEEDNLRAMGKLDSSSVKLRDMFGETLSPGQEREWEKLIEMVDSADSNTLQQALLSIPADSTSEPTNQALPAPSPIEESQSRGRRRPVPSRPKSRQTPISISEAAQESEDTPQTTLQDSLERKVRRDVEAERKRGIFRTKHQILSPEDLRKDEEEAERLGGKIQHLLKGSREGGVDEGRDEDFVSEEFDEAEEEREDEEEEVEDDDIEISENRERLSSVINEMRSQALSSLPISDPFIGRVPIGHPAGLGGERARDQQRLSQFSLLVDGGSQGKNKLQRGISGEKDWWKGTGRYPSPSPARDLQLSEDDEDETDRLWDLIEFGRAPDHDLSFLSLEDRRTLNINRAKQIFQHMQKHSSISSTDSPPPRPSQKVLNTLLQVHSEGQDEQGALELMQTMRSLGVSPDQSSFGHLIRMYVLKGDLDRAISTKAEMEGLGLTASPDSYGLLIDSLTRDKKIPEALNLLSEASKAVNLRLVGEKNLRYLRKQCEYLGVKHPAMPPNPAQWIKDAKESNWRTRHSPRTKVQRLMSALFGK